MLNFGTEVVHRRPLLGSNPRDSVEIGKTQGEVCPNTATWPLPVVNPQHLAKANLILGGPSNSH